MKQDRIVIAALIFFSTSFLFISCKEKKEYVKASLELELTEMIVPYTAGDSTIGVTSNDVYTVTVDDDGTDWLSYEILYDGDSIMVSYLQNDTTLERTGSLIIINDDVMRILTLTQEGLPGSNIIKLDIEYSVITSGSNTVLLISADECDNIPIGSTLVIECGDEGSISFLDDTYTEYLRGVPVDGTFSLVWSQTIADYTATSGVIALLNDGFSVTDVYALYGKTNIDYSIVESTNYDLFYVTAAVCQDIPVGASFVFETNSDVGNISILDDSYNIWAYCTPVNGKASFEWTSTAVTNTAANGISPGVMRDGFDVANVYYNHVQSELAYSVTISGGYTILSLPVEECAKIPIGATVVFECSSDAGTITFYDSSNNEVIVGSPADGICSFIWTSNISETFASGVTTAVLRNGFDITALYCYN